MDTAAILRTEETGSDYSPPNDFNIAEAFPVTDRLVREVARKKRIERIDRVTGSLGFRCAVAGCLGFVVGGLSARNRPWL